MIRVVYVDDSTAEYDADGWMLMRGVNERRESTFTSDIELRKADVPVAIIGTGTYKSVAVVPQA